jgi:2-oxoglutarate/2-oxoacid ferredoxin oxidoreductase subunit beta
MSMTTALLKTLELPYCKGCGHDLIAKNTVRALEKIGYQPLNVIMVTDIGCHGIIDKCLNTHTVHGLHGRSVALGAGITFGIENPDKKVIVFIGDGGSTIGLQHILEAARLNLNMTVVVHNNFLYGMTGGQTSGLTPYGFRTTTSAEGNPFAGYDLCAISHTSGAAYASRISGVGDISESLAEAFSVKGFSLTEVMEICPSYGVKLNPKRKLSEIIESSGKALGVWKNEREPFSNQAVHKSNDLLQSVSSIKQEFDNQLTGPISMVISGSAGEGVQLAATLLAKAAIHSGCHATQKGSYPVTVGVGFSTAEINLSAEEIHFHGIGTPDVAIITSSDGLAHSKKRILNMKKGLLIIDQGLEVPATKAEILQFDFRQIGARTACLLAIFAWVKITGILHVNAMEKAIEKSGMGDKLPMEKIKNLLTSF